MVLPTPISVVGIGASCSTTSNGGSPLLLSSGPTRLVTGSLETYLHINKSTGVSYQSLWGRRKQFQDLKVGNRANRQPEWFSTWGNRKLGVVEWVHCVSHLVPGANETERRESLWDSVIPSLFTKYMVSGHFVMLPPYDLPTGMGPVLSWIQEEYGIIWQEMMRLEYDKFVLSETNRRIKELHWQTRWMEGHHAQLS